MSRRDLFAPVTAAIVLVLFFGVLIHVLLLRYQRGDVYPAMSTLRADPLGARAFYEALEATGAFRVERGFVSTRRELAEKPATVFYLGLSTGDLEFVSDAERDEIDAYVRSGGRVVITFSAAEARDAGTPKKKPEAKKPDDKKAAKSPEPAPAPEKPFTNPETEQEKYERVQFRQEQENETAEEKRELSSDYKPSLAALWGFGWDRQKESTGGARNVPGTPLPGSGLADVVPWESALYFVRLEPAWRTVYSARGKPVLVRRTLGKGEIVLASDSYFVSNEALREDRAPGLLSFLAGPGGLLLFDEVHLGTEEQDGIMTLARRFRLEGFLYGLAFVVALFVWRRSVPLVPPQAVAPGSALGGAVSGKDSRSGLVNLLRRNIPSDELLQTCLSEWKRGITPNRTHLREKAAEMDAVIATAAPERIVETYQHLREINAPRRVKGTYATKS